MFGVVLQKCLHGGLLTVIGFDEAVEQVRRTVLFQRLLTQNKLCAAIMPETHGPRHAHKGGNGVFHIVPFGGAGGNVHGRDAVRVLHRFAGAAVKIVPFLHIAQGDGVTQFGKLKIVRGFSEIIGVAYGSDGMTGRVVEGRQVAFYQLQLALGQRIHAVNLCTGGNIAVCVFLHQG